MNSKFKHFIRRFSIKGKLSGSSSKTQSADTSCTSSSELGFKDKRKSRSKPELFDRANIKNISNILSDAQFATSDFSYNPTEINNSYPKFYIDDENDEISNLNYICSSSSPNGITVSRTDGVPSIDDSPKLIETTSVQNSTHHIQPLSPLKVLQQGRNSHTLEPSLHMNDGFILSNIFISIITTAISFGHNNWKRFVRVCDAPVNHYVRCAFSIVIFLVLASYYMYSRMIFMEIRISETIADLKLQIQRLSEESRTKPTSSSFDKQDLKAIREMLTQSFSMLAEFLSQVNAKAFT